MAWIDLHTHQIRVESNVRAILHLNPFAQAEGVKPFQWAFIHGIWRRAI